MNLMTDSMTWVWYIIGGVLLFVSCYGAYYILGRKTCTQVQMLRTTVLVLGFSYIADVLAWYIDAIPPAAVSAVTLVLVQMCSKIMLGFSTGRSWGALGLCVLLQILMVLPFVGFLFTDY